MDRSDLERAPHGATAAALARRLLVSAPLVAAILPLLHASLSDPETLGVDRDGRATIVGLAFGADRSFAPPIGQLLAGAAGLLPIGPIDLRAAIALAIPAAIASAMITARVARAPSSTTPLAHAALTIAAGALGGLFLASSGPGVALVALALELLARPRAKASRLLIREELILGGSIGLAIWASPRLAPVVLVACAFAPRSFARHRAADDPSPPGRSWSIAALGAFAIVPPAVVLLTHDGWLALGRPFVGGLFAAGEASQTSVTRAAIVILVLAATAIVMMRGLRGERGPLAIAASALVCGLLLSAKGALVVAAIALVPVAVRMAGALSIAVDRHLAVARLRPLAALVPALGLGLAARGFEVELEQRRLDLDGRAAHDLAAIVTWGVAPPRPALLLEDEETLLRWARERVVHGLRPDLRPVPTQRLLVTGAARVARRAMGALPSAADPIRALLARGVLESPDLAPLAQRVPVLAELPSARLRGVARNTSPTGGAPLLALERVEPSDRRIRRPAVERRLAVVSRGLARRPSTDRVRRALRLAAAREARLLAAAGDREAALVAVARASAFGLDDVTVARWTARITAKSTLDDEGEE